MTRTISVGIIGASPDRGWAAVAHIPALKSIPDFALTAVSTTRASTAAESARQFGVAHAFDNHHDLVTCPDVDLVVVAVKVPHHYELVSAALEAGKAVYCEWPLGNGLAETAELAELARRKGLHAVVGLQARSAPAINYVRDLIQQGYVGEVLSTTLIGSGMNWGPVMEQPNAYTGDIRNGATMLTIPLGHTVDALCHVLGEITEVTATAANRNTRFTVAETGEVLPMTAHDQLCVTGLLGNGAALAIHYRGGVSRGTNLLWEINGSEGDIQIVSNGGHAQMFELSVLGARGGETALQALPVPGRYRWAPPQPAPGFSFNVAQAYVRLAQDLRDSTRLCPTFDDAVVRHKLLHAIETAARTGERQRVN
ncbi:Gfo/Idh/MocA family protein [Paraburkholderia unamae]|uniref:Dehydrogenase n=1 Tax=Paraburkholderia unamae TaxID=219649 RepID=A0ABX5KHX9_9BURK|nr:Gfo/Idh/MocA family oxidoreductase [Paraburkholderia unamae]PVX75668.1 putative dehydrogenase [Paraburkholderia unamae]